MQYICYVLLLLRPPDFQRLLLCVSCRRQVLYVDGGRLALNYTVPVPEQ